MARYRVLSLAALLILALSAASLYAVDSARRAEQRGAEPGYPQPIRGAESLRLGVNVALEQYDDAALDARLADLAERGVRYVRQEFRWTDIEPKPGQYDWSASDRIISATLRHGMQIVAVLTTTPEWARGPSGSDEFPATATQPPQSVDDFASFAQAFAERYDRMDDGSPSSLVRRPSSMLAYQIWDEPNLSAAWGNGLINPELYLKMLRAAGAAIKRVNPDAQVLLAGLAPTVEQSNVNLAPQLYLRRLYELGGQDAFDLAAAKPYGFDSPPGDRRVDPNVLNFSHVILMRDEMVEHGDGDKAIWLTQFGWNALPDDWRGDKSIWGAATETEQARYTREAVQRVAREWPWAGGMFIDALQPPVEATDAHWGFALLSPISQPRPVYQAFTEALADAELAPRAQRFAIQDAGASRGVSTTYRPNPLANFSDGWRYGELGADIPQRDDAQVRFRFNGDGLALIVRRDNYRAYTFVTVDGRPANLLPTEPRGAYLTMTSPDLQPRVETIEVATALGPGQHEATVSIDRGWNQWALIGWSSRAESTTIDWTPVARWLALIGLAASALLLAVSLPRARWGEWIRDSLQRARPPTWQAVAAALIFWLSASLTWAQDAAMAYRALGTPANVVISASVSAIAFWSPVFVLSLAALAVLFILVLMRLDLGLMLLAFFIPFFILPQRLFERAFSMAELLTLMCAASWLLRGIRDWRLGIGDWGLEIGDWRLAVKGWRPAGLRLLDLGVLALVVVAALSALQADFRVEAMRELRVVILEPALLYAMLRASRLEHDQVWRIVDAFVLGGVVIAGVGLVNYAQGNVFTADLGFPRIKSIFGSPNNDALYLERVFPILLAGAIFRRQTTDNRQQTTDDGRRTADERHRPSSIARRLPRRRALYAVALLPVTAAIALSASRGALLLGVPAAVIVVLLTGGGRWRYIGFGLIGLMALGLAMLLSGAAAPFVAGTRFENALDLTRGTGFFRANLWQSAARMWQDHPWLGVGPDNFLYSYRGRYILPAAWQEPGLSHPHNIVLDFASRLGLLGLVAGAGMVAGLILTIGHSLGRLRRQGSALWVVGVGLAGLLAATLAHGLVDHSFFLVDLAFVFMLACGLAAQLARQATQETPS